MNKFNTMGQHEFFNKPNLDVEKAPRREIQLVSRAVAVQVGI
jgi:hypothetical protein